MSEDKERDGENQLYAEITDPISPAGVSTHVPAPTAPAASDPRSHHYDDVVLDVPKSGVEYQLTHCEAYGVHK